MRLKPLILTGLLVSLTCPWSHWAKAESLFHLDDGRILREQGRGYVNATLRLEQVRREGARRLQRVVVAIRRSRSAHEAQYWKMDYIQQRAWMVKAQARVCIDLIEEQERMLAECETAARARKTLRQSDFYLGMCTLHRMQQNLRAQSGLTPLEDGLLAITLASMGRREQRRVIVPWEQKRDELIARLRSMRQELVCLAQNLDRIDIDGGGHESTQ